MSILRDSRVSAACLRAHSSARRLALAALVCTAGPLLAQQGDRAAEDQSELPAGTPRPAVVVRAPAEAKDALRLQPGFSIELVAHEPLLGDPVQAVFDAKGRLWVCEMRSYMRDIDGTDELRADGRVAVLVDRDGDGRMDESVPFLDGVVLPRAVLPLQGGALVIVPPDLLWCVDADFDLKPERIETVCSGFDAGRTNPEHSGNGLLWGLDNRIHLAGDARMLTFAAGREPAPFAIEATAAAGQWGIAQDDRGRLYYNYNEDWLRSDLVPRRYAARTEPASMLPGMNHKLALDPAVHPAHPTPGVNRGGREGLLRDGWLTRHTAVCAPLVYRGDSLPGCDGDVFVCEPAGNVVRRFRLLDLDGATRAENRYEKAEFLAAVDERFRPVNLAQGPDGAIYVVDMYRGVIQHKNFVTTFLRRQVAERRLEQPIGMGRIWRIAAEGAKRAVPPSLDAASALELCDALGCRDGARRDLAQRLLVQRQERSAIPRLRELVRERRAPVSLHAIGALDGLGELSADDLRAVLHAEDAGLLAFALRFCAADLSRGDRVLTWACERLAKEAVPSVRRQLALTLGDVTGKGQDAALTLLAELGGSVGGDAMLAAHVASSARGREPELARLLVRGERPSPQLALSTLAQKAASAKNPALQERMLDVAAATMSIALQERMLAGFCAAIPSDPAKARGAFRFVATPPALAAMQRTGRAEVVPHVQRILASIELRADMPEPEGPSDESLAPEERMRVAAGARVYGAYCAACHQPQGQGLAGLAPPLAGSEWVTGEPERLVKVALHGVRGPLRAAGVAFEGEMPPQSHLGDADLAAALSYARRSFGHRASCIAPKDVAAIRAAHVDRATPWPANELQPK